MTYALAGRIRRWQLYHARHARLRVISAEANLGAVKRNQR